MSPVRTHQQTEELHNVGVLLEPSAIVFRIGVGSRHVHLRRIYPLQGWLSLNEKHRNGWTLTCTIEA
jgi:hypothetical protein